MNGEFTRIYSTRNYDMFKIKKENRELNENKVNVLMRDIRERGMQLQPIQVNRNMEIFDGQHRFEALKRLNMPVLYFIDRRLKVDDIIAINNTQSRWTMPDYIHSRKESGNENYLLFDVLLKEFGFCTYTTAIAVKGQVINERILKRGDFTMNKEEFENAAKKLAWLRKLEGAIDTPIISPRVFEGVVLRAYALPNINKERLFKTLVKNYRKSKFNYGNMDECIQAVADMYDTGYKSEYIYGDIKKSMRSFN